MSLDFQKNVDVSFMIFQRNKSIQRD